MGGECAYFDAPTYSCLTHNFKCPSSCWCIHSPSASDVYRQMVLAPGPAQATLRDRYSANRAARERGSRDRPNCPNMLSEGELEPTI